MPPVPQASWEALEAKGVSLSAEVYQQLARLPDLGFVPIVEELEGSEGTYQHHLLLMLSAFQLGNHEILARTFPWAYRVLANRGVPFDFWLAQFRAWRQAVEAALAPSLAAPIVDIYDWLIDEHLAMVQLSQDRATNFFTPVYPENPLGAAFTSLLLHGQRRSCLDLAAQVVKTPKDLQSFYLQGVQNSLYKLGLLWEWGDITVAAEHIASSIVNTVSASLYPRIAPTRMGRGLAVVACSPGERHGVGCRMLADFLELEGWDVLDLGANVPKPEILCLLKANPPFLFLLSIGTVFHLGRAKGLIQAIRALPGGPALRIMAGGVAVNTLRGVWRQLGADGTAADALGAALLANAWWDESPGGARPREDGEGSHQPPRTRPTRSNNVPMSNGF